MSKPSLDSRGPASMPQATRPRAVSSIFCFLEVIRRSSGRVGVPSLLRTSTRAIFGGGTPGMSILKLNGPHSKDEKQPAVRPMMLARPHAPLRFGMERVGDRGLKSNRYPILRRERRHASTCGLGGLKRFSGVEETSDADRNGCELPETSRGLEAERRPLSPAERLVRVVGAMFPKRPVACRSSAQDSFGAAPYERNPSITSATARPRQVA